MSVGEDGGRRRPLVSYAALRLGLVPAPVLVQTVPALAPVLVPVLAPALEPGFAFSLVLFGEGDVDGDSENSSSAVATSARPRDQRWALHRPYPQEWGSLMLATWLAVAPFDVVGACFGG